MRNLLRAVAKTQPDITGGATVEQLGDNKLVSDEDVGRLDLNVCCIEVIL